MMAECSHARDLWEAFRPIYARLMPNIRYTPHEAVLTANLQHLDFKEKKSKLLRTLSEIILHEIWSARCKCDKENIDPNLDRSIQSVVTTLETIIKAHYRYHINHDTLHIFKEKFCIDNVICKIDYHDYLNLYLPP